mmetsp:Transcript_13689/g.28067  ORF Transcript_13689/g.28067 Transcript_13689/m.28067 type:complete len:377 (-) Transcript_13689:4157-5287(-)
MGATQSAPEIRPEGEVSENRDLEEGTSASPENRRPRTETLGRRPSLRSADRPPPLENLWSTGVEQEEAPATMDHFEGTVASPIPINPFLVHTDIISNTLVLDKQTLTLRCDDEDPNLYLLEFRFNATVDGSISVYYCAQETTDLSRERRQTFEGRHETKPNKTSFRAGRGQLYQQKRSRALDISKYSPEELIWDPSSDVFPVVIRLEVSTEPTDEAYSRAEVAVQSQVTLATLRSMTKPENASTSTYGIEVIRQSILAGDMVYQLVEVYGLNSSVQDEASSDDLHQLVSGEDSAECVICLSDPRDTAILPCRHFCLCLPCGQRLRLRSNRCPVCRMRVESLLQIKRNSGTTAGHDDNPRLLSHATSDSGEIMGHTE